MNTTRESAVRIGLLYPDLLGTYGDRGNAMVLGHRLAGRGIAQNIAQEQITAIPGFAAAFSGPFFHEFAVRCPVPPRQVYRYLRERGMVGGYPLGREYPELSDCMLFCVTEKRTRAEIDALAEALSEIGAQPPLPADE